MKKGDLISVSYEKQHSGFGIFLGLQSRGTNKSFYSLYWKGRVATFDPKVWEFKVINVN